MTEGMGQRGNSFGLSPAAIHTRGDFFARPTMGHRLAADRSGEHVLTGVLNNVGKTPFAASLIARSTAVVRRGPARIL